MRINLNVEITQNELCSELVQKMNHHALKTLIMDIDAQTQDWGFTKELYKYFAAEMEKYKEENLD